MTWEILFIFTLLIGALISFTMEKIPTDLTALLLFAIVIIVSIASSSEHMPTVEELFSVFSNPAPLTVAAMFIISAALEKCGAIEIMSRFLSRLTKIGYSSFILFLVAIVATLSAFVNNTPVVVVLMPVVLSLSRPLGVAASKLLIPLSYASIFGGCCTLIGTSTNILASGILSEHDQPPIGMFELGKVGLPLLFIGALYLAFFARKLLPNRETLTSILSEDERKEYITEAYVKVDSPIIGKSTTEVSIFRAHGIRILEIIRNGVALSEDPSSVTLNSGDRLILACRAKAIAQAHSAEGINFVSEEGLGLEQIAAHESSIVEGVISPTSGILGFNIREINFRQRYRMIILAIHRRGRNVREKLGSLRLESGDTLLMMGTNQAIEYIRRTNDIILLDRPPIPALNLRKKMPIVLSVIVGVVLLSAFKVMPIIAATMVAVAILFVTGCLKTKEGYGSVEWSILVLIYGMLAMGVAMEKTGASIFIAENLSTLVNFFTPEEWQPIVMLACIYFCTWVLTEVLSNNATVVLMVPIALSLAQTLQVDPRPFAIAACIASSASFSTPIGYQTNTYVYGVGGYRFSDFSKVGIPLNLIYWGMSVLLIPKIWPF